MPEQSMLVNGERFRLLILLANLLSNAIKYSPKGGEVRCTVRQHRRRIEVSVADRGIGLQPTEMRRLFQPFTRLPEGMKVTSSGLGLGLHLSQAIAEAHGGTLTAAANPGGGSIFTLSLPVTNQAPVPGHGLLSIEPERPARPGPVIYDRQHPCVHA